MQMKNLDYQLQKNKNGLKDFVKARRSGKSAWKRYVID